MERPTLSKEITLEGLARLVAWLDEEHRKDRAEITLLHQKLDSQLASSQNMEGRLREIQVALKAAQEQIERWRSLELEITPIKGQLAHWEERERRRQEEETKALELKRLEQEQGAKAQAELRLALDALGKRCDSLEGRLALHAEDTKRSIASLAALASNVEALTKQVLSLAERLGQVESERVGTMERLRALEPIGETLRNQQAQLTQALALLRGDVDHWRTELTRAVDEVRQALERASSQVRLLATEVAQSRQEISKIQTREENLYQRTVEISGVLKHYAKQQTQDIGELTALRQYVEELVRQNRELREKVQILAEKLDSAMEQVSQLTRMGEDLKQNQERLAQLEALTEDRWAREVPALQLLAEATERRTLEQGADLEQLTLVQREQGALLTSQVKQWEEDRRYLQRRVEALAELFEMQRRRSLAHLQQEIKEWEDAVH
ncbi:MAG: hypothetical protein HY783_05285 [Chloroflexi bacterium]|nr:hypothetical protein [Chloroflexota bacterium]